MKSFYSEPALRNVGFFLLKLNFSLTKRFKQTKKSAMEKRAGLFSKETCIRVNSLTNLCRFAVLRDIAFLAVLTRVEHNSATAAAVF